MHKGYIIIQGTHNIGKLWTIDPLAPTINSLNSIVDDPTITDRMKFYTTSLFYPTLAILAKAISTGYLTTFPSFITKQL